MQDCIMVEVKKKRQKIHVCLEIVNFHSHHGYIKMKRDNYYLEVVSKVPYTPLKFLIMVTNLISIHVLK